MSKNGGGSWERISNSFPKDLWVSRVIASQHKKGRVYVTLNGYRWDDFNAYVYMSEDYGKTWKDISSNIPASPVNVIREDSENSSLLYIGTDNGAYASFTNGEKWFPFYGGLPNVAVHDLVIQPEAKHLILGTHGRSLYRANIAPMQKMSDEIASKETHIFKVSDIRKRQNWGSTWSKWLKPNTPKITIPFYSKENKKIVIEVFSDQLKINSFSVDADKGFNEVEFDVSFSKTGINEYLKIHKNATVSKAQNGVYYLPKGTYKIKIGASSREFKVR